MKISVRQLSILALRCINVIRASRRAYRAALFLNGQRLDEAPVMREWQRLNIVQRDKRKLVYYIDMAAHEAWMKEQVQSNEMEEMLGQEDWPLPDWVK